MVAWAMAAQAVANVIGGIGGGVLQEAQINAQNTVNEANAYANNLVRSANNGLRASRANLARFVQSENNKRVLQNTGAALATNEVNSRRSRDQANANDFESQIAFAEQAGAQAAAAALSGLRGGVADLVNGTTALRKARLQYQSKEAMRMADSDAGKRNADILQAGWDNLDQSEIDAGLDYSKDVAAQHVYTGNLLNETLSSVNAKDLANTFGGGGKYDAFAPTEKQLIHKGGY